jgi:hypothetical protein
MDPGQRAVIAEIVEILANRLRRHLEATSQVFDHHPAEGTGNVQDSGSRTTIPAAC